ncbi:MAG: polymer-forming cytoskeletal protein [Caldilineales bacterium]
MVRSRFVLIVLLACVLLVTAAAPVLAQSDTPGKLVFGSNYVLASGQSLSGDLGVLGGNAVIEQGATVNGDVMVAGGTLTVAGQVNGDIAVFGGSAVLHDSARITGDVVSFGGSVDRSEKATVLGSVQSRGDGSDLPVPGMLTPENFNIAPGQIQPPNRSFGDWLLAVVLRVIRVLVMTLAMAALAALLALVWPRGIERLSDTVRLQPLPVFLVGVLSWIIGMGLVLIFAITICLLPVALALAAVLVAAALLSWVITGWMVGHRLLALLHLRQSNMVLEAGIGTFLLMAVYFMLGVVGCFAFVFGAVVASIGTGALVLTRFGTRPYPPLAVASTHSDYTIQISGALPPAVEEADDSAR